jgi:hypothetical protein
MSIRVQSCSGLTLAIIPDQERWLEVVGRGASQEVPQISSVSGSSRLRETSKHWTRFLESYCSRIIAAEGT